MNKNSILSFALCSIAGISNANAASIYTDEISFLNALLNPVIEGFETAPSPPIPGGVAAFPLFSSQGVVYTQGSGGNLYAVDGTGVFPVSGKAIFAELADTNIRLDFTAPVVAVGGYVASAYPTTGGVNVEVFLEAGGTTASINLTDSGNHFIGIVDTTGVSHASFYDVDPGTNFGLDNVSFATSVVPVPAAVWLFASGLAGLLGLARRKTATVPR
jgi:hypothetical protein